MRIYVETVSDCDLPVDMKGSSYSLDRTKAAEFSLQVCFLNFITESRNKESLVRVASSLRVFLGVVCHKEILISKGPSNTEGVIEVTHTVLHAFRQLLGQPIPALQPLAPLALEPALSSIVGRFLFKLLCLSEKLGHAGDGALHDILRGAVAGRQVAKGRPRLEQGQQRRGELVRHFDTGLLKKASGVSRRQWVGRALAVVDAVNATV